MATPMGHAAKTAMWMIASLAFPKVFFFFVLLVVLSLFVLPFIVAISIFLLALTANF